MTMKKISVVAFALAGGLVFCLMASPASSQIIRPTLPDCGSCNCSSGCATKCMSDGGTESTCGLEGVCGSPPSPSCASPPTSGDPCASATPPTSCDLIVSCPFDLTGWSNIWGTCTSGDGEHGCVEECLLWCNKTTLQFCKDTNSCAVQ